MFFSCKEKITEPKPPPPMNPNIVLIRPWCEERENICGDQQMGVWHGNKIYTVSVLRQLTLNQQFGVIEDSLLRLTPNFSIPGFPWYVARNESGTKLLLVMSKYSNVSMGDLIEVDLQTYTFHVLLDSSYNVSSALYFQGDSDCIYYSYYHPTTQLGGYYYLNINIGQDSLLFPHISEISASEVINGFDISPDRLKILYPINYREITPQLVEYNLSSGQHETLAVNFERQILWVRYNPTYNQIVYSNYPIGSGGFTVWDDSEIGVIDRATLTKRIMDVNTNPGGLSVNVFPNWSSDGKHIVYGSAKGPAREPPGAKSYYSLYVLKNVN